MNSNRVSDGYVSSFIISFFIISNIGLYYPQFDYLTLASQLALIVYAAYIFVMHGSGQARGFMVASGLFVFYAYLSSMWAESAVQANEASLILAKSVFFAVLLAIACRSKESCLIAMKFFAHGGLLFGLIFVWGINLDGLSYSRIDVADNDDAPNMNFVALTVGISSAIYFYEYLRQKKLIFLLLLGLTIVVVFILGSRKSIVITVVASALIWMKLEGASKLRTLFVALLLVYVGLLIAPADYTEYIIDRFSSLGLFSGDFSQVDESDKIRKELFQAGVSYIKEKPLFGFGLDNFSYIFGQKTGLYISPHNQYIDILSGLGVVGFILYSYLYYKIWSPVRVGGGLTVGYLVLVVVVVILLNGLLISFVGSRYIWILLSILYMTSRAFGSKNIENEK